MNRSTRFDLTNDLSWVPVDYRSDARSGEALDPQVYTEGYLADPTEWHWSTYDGPPEIKLRRVMAILEQARLPEHDKAIRQLGVGPFEDMMSHWLLDHLEAYMPFNDTLRQALEGLYIFNEPQAVQDRLARMRRQAKRRQAYDQIEIIKREIPDFELCTKTGCVIIRDADETLADLVAAHREVDAVLPTDGNGGRERRPYLVQHLLAGVTRLGRSWYRLCPGMDA